VFLPVAIIVKEPAELILVMGAVLVELVVEVEA
jgi:predicted aconitase with swiveling domain